MDVTLSGWIVHEYEAKSLVKITWLLVVLVGVVENVFLENPLNNIY